MLRTCNAFAIPEMTVHLGYTFLSGGAFLGNQTYDLGTVDNMSYRNANVKT